MAFDTYLVIPDIPGEATGLADGIEVLSFSWGTNNTTSIGSGTSGISSGRVSMLSFSIMKRTDKASTKLFLASCNGQVIPEMTVHMRKQTGAGGQADFLVYKFNEVLVESIHWAGSSNGEDTPTESVSFVYGKVNITYSAQGPDGALAVAGEAEYDLHLVHGA